MPNGATKPWSISNSSSLRRIQGVSDRDDYVVWRLDPDITDEVLGKLAGMRGNGPCHNYVDISTPADTLVLSLEEYFEPSAVVHTSPFGYF